MNTKEKQSLLVLVGCVAILGIILYGMYSWTAYGALVSPLPATCTLGVEGTAANITFSGWGAQHVCDGAAASDRKVLYAQSTAPQGTELCEGDIQRKMTTIHYIVRDSGFFNIVGNTLCKEIDKLAG